MVESLSRWTSGPSLFIDLGNRSDSRCARKLFKTLITIHVSINNGGYDTAFPVPRQAKSIFVSSVYTALIETLALMACYKKIEHKK